MKTFTKSLTVFLMLLCSSILWAYDFQEGDFYYTITTEEDSSENTVQVTWGGSKNNAGTSSYTGDMVIPSSITHDGVTYAVTDIGDSAFYGCSGLTSIVIPDGMTFSGQYTFRDCTSLAPVTLPEGTTAVVGSMFYNCSAFDTFTLPASVTSVGNASFQKCSNLETFYSLNPEPPSVGNSLSFSGVPTSTCILYVPKGSKEAYASATRWSDFVNIEEIEEESQPLEEGEKFQADGFFFEVVSSDNRTVQVTWGGSKNNSGTDSYTGDMVIPTSVTYEDVTYTVIGLGDSAFYGCSGLTSIVIPDGMTFSGQYTFRDCTSLAPVTLPEGTTAVVGSMFYNCTAFNTFTLPASVTSVGNASFQKCSNLETFYSLNPEPPSVGNSLSFSGVPTSTCVLYVPKGSKEAYASATRWSDFVNIEEIYDGSNPDEVGTMFEVEGIYYKVTSVETATVEVTYGNGAEKPTDSYTGAIEIPSEVTNPDSEVLYTVVGVGEDAFYDCTGLTSLSLPSTVTYIDADGLNGCTGLTVLPTMESVTTLGNYAFYYCTGLETVNIPDCVTSIGNYCFASCSKISELTLGEAVETIGTNAFDGCNNFEELIIPLSVTSINNFAFNCSGVKSVTSLNESPATCQANAFYAVANAGAVLYVKEGMKETYANAIGWKQFKTIEEVEIIEVGTVFEDNGIYYSVTSLENATVEVTYGNGAQQATESYVGDLEVPSQITHSDVVYTVIGVGEYAFYGCTGLTSLILPSTATYIKSSAFRACTGLSELPTMDAVTEIGSYGFYSCTGIKTLNMPDCVISIGDYSFGGCSGITGLTLSESLQSVGQFAFDGDDNFEDLVIPLSVTNISNFAFNCLGLYTVTSLNTTPATCGANAFYAPANVGAILYVREGMKDTYANATGWKQFYDIREVEVIEEGTIFEDNDIYYKVTSVSEATVEVTYGNEDYNTPTESYVGDMEIPSQITHSDVVYTVVGVGEYAFYGCSDLTSLILPSTATYINSSAFRACTGLSDLPSMDAVTDIGSYGFYGCTGLSTLTIPNCVKSIGSYCFGDCSKISELNLGESLESIGTNAFDGCNEFENLIIPLSVTSIGNFAFQCSGIESVTSLNTTPATCQANAFYLPASLGAILYVAEGMKDIYAAATGWKQFKTIEEIEVIEVGSVLEDNGIYYKVTSVSEATVEVTYGNEDYNTPTEAYVGDMEIPSQITHSDVVYTVIGVGEYAFYGCTGLTSLILPSTATYISSSAFRGCTGLSKLPSMDAVTELGSYAFYACTGLGDVTIPDAVTSIGSYCFASCSSISSLTLNESLESVGSFAFDACNGFEDLVIPLSVTFIGNYAFNCGGLESVTSLNETPATCEANAFYLPTSYGATLYVSYGCKDVYAEATGWKKFTKIEELVPEGIGGVNANGMIEVDRYTVNGQKIDTEVKGINIIRYSDGSVRKVYVK